MSLSSIPPPPEDAANTGNIIKQKSKKSMDKSRIFDNKESKIVTIKDF